MEFFEYVTAAFRHLWPLLSAGSLLGIEEVLERYWPPAKKWSDQRIGKYRRGLQLGALFAALFYSGYLAWSEEHSARLKSENVAALAGQRQDRHLSEAQKTKLETALKEIAPQIPPIWVKAERTAESNQYGIEFMKLFHRASIKMINGGDEKRLFPVETQAGSTENHGVMLGVHDQDHPPESAILLKRALISAGISVSFVDDYGLAPNEESFTLAILSP